MGKEPEIIKAPFTSQQVKALNFYQESGVFHEFTCGTKSSHPGIQKVLIATQEGWQCPDESCDYRQNWAHDFMANRPFVESQIRLKEFLFLSTEDKIIRISLTPGEL